MNFGGGPISETSFAGGPMVAGAPPVYLELSEALVVYCQAADFLV